MKNHAFTKLEQMKIEMKTLEGRDQSQDIWKEKCKELFNICKEMQVENEDLRTKFAVM